MKPTRFEVLLAVVAVDVAGIEVFIGAVRLEFCEYFDVFLATWAILVEICF